MTRNTLQRIITGIVVISVLMGGIIAFRAIGTQLGQQPNIITGLPRSAINYNHGTINIEGNAGFTGGNGVISGSGTFQSPFLIANWIINAAAADGIYINNTNAYVIIQNCTVENGLKY